MKIQKFKSNMYILSIFIFAVVKSFNILVKASPINDNVFDILQTIDKESNVTANTNKLTFKLILNPVDESNKSLGFNLKLKSSLWITTDEFISLRNYLSDTDLSNGLKIIRRKFFRRYNSDDLKNDNLRYKLLSILVFSSLQGQVHLLRNRLNDQHPELLVLVSGFHTNHKNADDWKPLTSTTEDFQFLVENGPAETPTTPGVSVSSEYDKVYYEKMIFNSIKLLGFSGSSSTPVSEPLTPSEKPVKEEAATRAPASEATPPNATNETKPASVAENDKNLIDFGSTPTEPKPTEGTPSEEPKQEPVEPSNEAPAETSKEASSENVSPTGGDNAERVFKKATYKQKNTTPESESEPSVAGPSNENSNEQQDDDSDTESVKSRKRKATEMNSEPTASESETSSVFSSPKRNNQGPSQPASPVDNNVVDKDNPMPTEELKSNQSTENDQANQSGSTVPSGSSSQESPASSPEEVKPAQPTDEVQPTDNTAPVPTDVVNGSGTVEFADVAGPSGTSAGAQPASSTGTSGEAQTPSPSEPIKSGPVDNNVVDKDNPMPTEEVKSNQVSERPTESSVASTGNVNPPLPAESDNRGSGDTLSNVRKGADSSLKTTFSLQGNDTENKPKFYQKAGQEEEQNTVEAAESSESENELEETAPASGKTKEQLLEELQKRYPAYDETDLMNKFERVDTEDVDKDFKSPLTITLKINFLSSDSRISVPVVTSAKLLLPKTIFSMCIREELTQQCAFELKDRLMARFEDSSAEAFKWGRLVSLLQTLAFQNDVFVEKYVMVSGGESVIEIAKPNFLLPMKTLYFLSQLVGKASSSDGQAQITFELLPGPLSVPLGSIASDLGQNYGVHAQLSRFIDLYTDFEITHSLFDLPNRKRVFKKSGVQKGRKSRSEGNKVYSMDELLSMNVDTKDLNNDIHFILSGYEKALFSVPKRLSGYKMLWETVDKYPELQRIWIEALTLMKLMDKKDNLRNFLANHTFKYQELKDLFEITYGIIAADNFNAVRDFYESVGITQKDVDTNLARVKSLFFAKTGSNVTRLPPMLKPMHSNCLVKDLITSLTSNDVIERFQVMFVQWINEHKNSADSGNMNLAMLCAGSSVLLQHWHYFQLDQGFYDAPVPFITLITSFSRLAQGKYKNPERKKEIKELINSKAAKACRKYINAAGIVATSPYKTATINMTPKSLLGAIANALDVSMDSPPLEIAYAMKDYFRAELSKGRFGNSLGICMSLQLLHRLNTCLSVERSNDFSVYMHSLLTMDTRAILEQYTEIASNTKNPKKNQQLLMFACDPDNPTVHEAMSKLMPIVSTQSHLDLMDELVRREMLSPDLTPEGFLATNDETLNKDVVDLEDDTTTLLETFEDTNPRSLLEIADEVSYSDDDDEAGEDSEGSFLQENYTHGGYPFDVDMVGMPDLASMDSLYKKLFSPALFSNFVSGSLNDKALSQLFNPDSRFGPGGAGADRLLDDDFAMITFDIRMEPSDARDQLVALDVPFFFHEKELSLIESLEATSLLRLLLYRISKRISSLEFDLKHEQLKKQALELAKSRRLEHVSIPVHELVAQGNVDLNTYRGLLRVLESMPEDGYYFEDQGLVVPNERVGRLAAKRIHKSLYRNKKSKSSKKSAKRHVRNAESPVMILQLIDPVDDTDINELTMPHEHVKKHDRLFYEKMTEL